MKYSKLIGWILLITGLVVIGWTLISSYNIFTARTEPPAVFEILFGNESDASFSPIESQEDIEEMVGEQLKQILPLDALPKMLDLIAWSILAFILVFGGAQISGLGIKLIQTPERSEVR